jgi:hypothetical protein
MDDALCQFSQRAGIIPGLAPNTLQCPNPECNRIWPRLGRTDYSLPRHAVARGTDDRLRR